jgi:hypothetical protein
MSSELQTIPVVPAGTAGLPRGPGGANRRRRRRWVYGFSQIVMGIEVRQAGKTLDPVTEKVA